MEEKTRQARAERTRQALLVAARDVFTLKGYQAASVASITEGADTAHGTFYLYFRNKEDVFIHVIGEVWDELYTEAFSGDDGPITAYDPSKPRQGIAGAIEVYVKHGPLWRALLEGALASAAIEQAWSRHRARVQEELAARFVLFQSQGILRPIDPTLAAEGLVSMLEWFALNRLAFPTNQPLGADDDVVATLIDLWIHALGIVT